MMSFRIVFLAASVALFLPSCGGDTSLSGELSMVPGLSFIHVHVDHDFHSTLLTTMFGGADPAWLIDSLVARGDLGLSLLSVNLSDLSPQLLFLSKNVGPSRMVEICTSGYSCRSEDRGERTDLLDERGSILGSIASRDGWTCFITGTGADRTAEIWLELEFQASMAADTDLATVAGSDAGLTILVSRNTISFLSVIPTGMLSGRQLAMLNLARDLIGEFDPRALSIGLHLGETAGSQATLELRMARSGGAVSQLTVSLSDSEISPVELTGAAAAMLGIQ